MPPTLVGISVGLSDGALLPCLQRHSEQRDSLLSALHACGLHGCSAGLLFFLLVLLHQDQLPAAGLLLSAIWFGLCCLWFVCRTSATSQQKSTLLCVVNPWLSLWLTPQALLASFSLPHHPSSEPFLCFISPPFPGELPTSKPRGSELPAGVLSLWPWDQAGQSPVPKPLQQESRGRHRGSAGAGC